MVHVKFCTCIRKHEHTAVQRDTRKLKHVQTFDVVTIASRVLGFTPSALRPVTVFRQAISHERH